MLRKITVPCVIAAALLLAHSLNVSAASTKVVVKPQTVAALKKASRAELPVQAATMVKNASASTRQAYALEVTEAAIQLSPATAGTIVRAIAQAVPEVAPAITAHAISLQPTQQRNVIEQVTPVVSSEVVAQINVAVTKAAAAVTPNAGPTIDNGDGTPPSTGNQILTTKAVQGTATKNGSGAYSGTTRP